MPIIVSPHPNETGKIIGLLEKLGGKAKEDFRFTYFESREALEVTEELYEQWQASPEGSAAAEAGEPSDEEQEGGEPPEVFALAAGVSTVAEHHTHSHTATLGRNSVAERNLHNYAATRDANTITPRTAHDQDDAPPPPALALNVTATATPLEASAVVDNGGNPATVNWGDTATSPSTGDGTTAVTHTYAAANTYTVTATDDANPARTDSQQVTVAAALAVQGGEATGEESSGTPENGDDADAETPAPKRTARRK